MSIWLARLLDPVWQINQWDASEVAGAPSAHTYLLRGWTRNRHTGSCLIHGYESCIISAPPPPKVKYESLTTGRADKRLCEAAAAGTWRREERPRPRRRTSPNCYCFTHLQSEAILTPLEAGNARIDGKLRPNLDRRPFLGRYRARRYIFSVINEVSLSPNHDRSNQYRDRLKGVAVY